MNFKGFSWKSSFLAPFSTWHNGKSVYSYPWPGKAVGRRMNMELHLHETITLLLEEKQNGQRNA